MRFVTLLVPDDRKAFNFQFSIKKSIRLLQLNWNCHQLLSSRSWLYLFRWLISLSQTWLECLLHQKFAKEIIAQGNDHVSNWIVMNFYFPFDKCNWLFSGLFDCQTEMLKIKFNDFYFYFYLMVGQKVKSNKNSWNKELLFLKLCPFELKKGENEKMNNWS